MEDGRFLPAVEMTVGKGQRERKTEVGSWKLEVGSWKLEEGRGKIEEMSEERGSDQ